MTKESFWFRGTFYETEEELMKESEKFNLSRITGFTVEETMLHMRGEVRMNVVDLLRISIRNCEFDEIISEARNFIILRCLEKQKENESTP